MDNLTHSFVGLAAAKAGLERVSPYATVVCVLAANVPDADVVTLAGGSLTYLKHHRGITHSIVGTLVLGLALPLLFVAAERLVARARGVEPRSRLRGLVLVSLLVTASHPLLDWTNSYGLRPFLPWSGRWYYGDLVFVIDPWIWLALGAACFLLTATTVWRVALWTLLALAVAAAVLLLTRDGGLEIPLAARVLWLGGLAAVVYAYRARVGERRGAAVARAALAAVVVYWGALAGLHSRASVQAETFARELAATGGETVQEVAAMPAPMNPLAWACVAETERATYRYEVRLAGGGARLLSRFEKPRGADALAVERAAREPRAVVLLDFARFPVAQVRPGPAGLSLVRITDVRFGEPAEGDGGGGNFSVEIPVSAR
ncbi:MAG TPA: metal-dependent hydrolase [Pyrinomonadaceae bacterium]